MHRPALCIPAQILGAPFLSPFSRCPCQVRSALVRKVAGDHRQAGHRAAAACRGFGTVRFTAPEDAMAAVEAVSGSQIGGRIISVRIDRFA